MKVNYIMYDTKRTERKAQISQKYAQRILITVVISYMNYIMCLEVFLHVNYIGIDFVKIVKYCLL